MRLIFKTWKIFIPLVAVIFSFSATMPAHANDAEFAAHIQSQNDKFMSAFNSQDASALAQLYTPDGVFIANNASPARGHAEITDLMNTIFSGPAITLSLVTSTLDKNGNSATEIGTWTMKIKPENAAAIIQTGNYVVVWEKQATGGWLMTTDIINSDMPAS